MQTTYLIWLRIIFQKNYLNFCVISIQILSLSSNNLNYILAWCLLLSMGIIMQAQSSDYWHDWRIEHTQTILPHIKPYHHKRVPDMHDRFPFIETIPIISIWLIDLIDFRIAKRMRVELTMMVYSGCGLKVDSILHPSDNSPYSKEVYFLTPIDRMGWTCRLSKCANTSFRDECHSTHKYYYIVIIIKTIDIWSKRTETDALLNSVLNCWEKMGRSYHWEMHYAYFDKHFKDNNWL